MGKNHNHVRPAWPPQTACPHTRSTHKQLGWLSDHTGAELAGNRDGPTEMTCPAGIQGLTHFCFWEQHLSLLVSLMTQTPSIRLQRGHVSPSQSSRVTPLPVFLHLLSYSMEPKHLHLNQVCHLLAVWPRSTYLTSLSSGSSAIKGG